MPILSKRLLILAAIVLPHCTGCVAFAYPTAVHVPELTVPNPDGNVHAFRIDVEKTERPLDWPTAKKYTLSRIPIDPQGLIPSQLEIVPVSGVLNPFRLAGVAEERSQFTMLVRAYRPGFSTIEVRTWTKSRELQWLPAPDLADQEQAIDDLLAVPVFKGPSSMRWGKWDPNPLWWEPRENPDFPLQPGSVSATHRQALLFAAGEYKRLAKGATAATKKMQTEREQLQQKAIWLRVFADRTR